MTGVQTCALPIYPVVNVVPDDAEMVRVLENLVTDRVSLADRAACGRQFVEKHNSAPVVTGRFMRVWEQVAR